MRPGSPERARRTSVRSSAASTSSAASSSSSAHALELVERAEQRVVRPQIAERGSADRRRLEPVRRSEHRRRQPANRVDGRGRGPHRLEHSERRAVAESDRLGLGALAVVHRPPAQPALEEVGVRPGEARVRRAQEAVELAATAALPREAEQREERLAERRRAEPDAALDGERNAKRAERGLERRPQPFERRPDERDLVRRSSGLDQREDLLADELERRPHARALEEADGAFERRTGCRIVPEERPLEVRDRGVRVLREPSRQLLDITVGEPGEVGHGALERGEGRTARLVGEGDVDLGSTCERLEQPPLRPGQVLEAVGEDRLALPRAEIAREPLDRAAAKQAAVPEPDPVELLPVGGVERRHVAVERLGVEQARVELRKRGREGVGEAGEAGRRAEAVQRGAGDRAADEQPALRRTGDGPGLAVRSGQPLEEVVEGADRAGEQGGTPRQEVTLDPVDVRPVGHDEHWVALQRIQIPLEQQRDLAGVRRPNGECEPHPAIVVRASDGFPPGARRRPERADFLRGRCRLRPAAAAGDSLAGHLAGAVVAQIGLLRATPCVRIAHAQHGPLAFTDFLAAVVANQHGLSRHDSSRCRSSRQQTIDEMPRKSRRQRATGEYATNGAS